MSVITKGRHGLQRRGNTEIDADFTISKNNTEVIVSSGTFIDVDGAEYDIPETSKDIGTFSEETGIGIWLHEDSNSNVKIHIGQERPSNTIQMFVAPSWFRVPANTSELSNVDMYAFGWIDEHPREVEKQLPSDSKCVAHSDIQKLKKNGEELKLKDVDVVIQNPENPTNNSQVRTV